MSEIDEFYVHTVTGETLNGSGPYGDSYLPFADVPCFIEEKRRFVRSATGEQIVSETTIWCAPEHYDKFKPDSKVKVREYDTKVITRSLADSGGLELPDHVSVYLE